MTLNRIVMLCSTLAIAGCNMAAAPGTAKPVATEAKPAAAAPAKEATPPAVPVKKPEPPKEKQLALNGRFETWDKDLPEGWIGDKTKIAKAVEATSGKNAVELRESDEYVILEQNVPNVPKGKKLLVSAKIKASSPRDVALKALYFQGAEDKSERVQYKGNGSWKVTSFEMTLPDDATAKSFRVQILRGPDTEGPVLVDDVAVIVKP
jgi:hypothetical protein